MKLIHIADTHPGLAAFSRSDPGSGMNLRGRQICDNFLRATNEIIQQKPAPFVHAGDHLDTIQPGTKTCTTVPEAPGFLNEAGILPVIIAGSHGMTRTRYTKYPMRRVPP
jgi:DNA repair exonuclease SbcCD nuclease subunit